jgi:hypothetical protein
MTRKLYPISFVKNFGLASAFLSLLLTSCGENNNDGANLERANKTLFFQNFAKRGDPLGFRMEEPVVPENVPRGEHYWSATYDERGRIVVLKSILAPACLQSTKVYTYRENDPWPVKRDDTVSTNCGMA